MKLNPVQQSIEMFGEVSRLAAIQELKIRLLASKTKAIEDSAYEFSVAATNKKIIEHFSVLKAITDEQSDWLAKSQKIRNKILHCEFNTAIKLIEELTGTQAPGKSIQVIKIDPNSGGEELLKNLFSAHTAMAEGKAGPHQDASAMNDKDLKVLGGLLNCVQTGAMEMALDIFQKSNDLIDDLMKIDTKIV